MPPNFPDMLRQLWKAVHKFRESTLFGAINVLVMAGTTVITMARRHDEDSAVTTVAKVRLS